MGITHRPHRTTRSWLSFRAFIHWLHSNTLAASNSDLLSETVDLPPHQNDATRPQSIRAAWEARLERADTLHNAFWLCFWIVVLGIAWLVGFETLWPPTATWADPNAPLGSGLIRSGVQYRPETIADWSSKIGGSLATHAQVIGGVFGVMVTVMTVALQLLAQRHDADSLLVPYLVRRLKFRWMGAVAAALTILDLTCGLLPSLGVPCNLRLLGWLNVLVAPFLLLAALRVTFHLLRDGAGTPFEVAKHIIHADMRSLAMRNARLARTASLLHEKASALGLKMQFSLAHQLRRRTGKDLPPDQLPRPIGHGELGVIADVRISALSGLSECLKSLPQGWLISIEAQPGERAADRSTVILYPDEQQSEATPKREVSGGPLLGGNVTLGTTAQPPEVPSEPDLRRLGRHAARLFVYAGVANEHEDDLDRYIARVNSYSLELVTSGSVVKLRQILTTIEHVMAALMDFATSGDAHQAPRFWRIERPMLEQADPFGLAQVAFAAVRTRSVDTITTVGDTAVTVFYRGLECEHVPSVAVASQVLQILYARIDPASPNIGVVSKWLDGQLSSIGWHFTSTASDGAQSAFASKRELLYQSASLLLQLVRYAIDFGDSVGAANFLDRLVRIQASTADRRNRDIAAPTKESIDTLIDYCMILASGWAQLKSHSTDAQVRHAATRVAQLAQNRLPRASRIVGLWELYHGSTDPHSEVDDSLGVSHWDLDDRNERRVGIAFSASYSGEWIADAPIVAIMASNPTHDSRFRKYFSGPPSRHLWQRDRLRDRLQTIARGPLFGLDEATATAVSSRVMMLLSLRDLEAERASRLAAASASSGFVSSESMDIAIAHDAAHRMGLTTLIQDLGQPQREATWCCGCPSVFNVRLSRSAALAESSNSKTVTTFYSEYSARIRDQHLAYLCDHLAERGPSVATLSTLRSHVEAAIERLTGLGASPDFVMLPAFDRFPAALFGLPFSHLPDLEPLDSVSWGRWRGLRLVRAPYQDFRSVIVGCSRIAFGTVKRPSPSVVSRLEDTTPERLNEFIARVTAAARMEDLPNPEDLFVRRHLRVFPLLGLNALSPGAKHPMGLLALPLEVTGVGFVLERDSKVYHRPDCAAIPQGRPLEHSLLRPRHSAAKPPAPCPVCNPQRWDFDGRLGRLSGVSPDPQTTASPPNTGNESEHWDDDEMGDVMDD